MLCKICDGVVKLNHEREMNPATGDQVFIPLILCEVAAQESSGQSHLSHSILSRQSLSQ